MYRFAGASGQSIEVIKRLSLWEFAALVDGFSKFHSPSSTDDEDTLTDEEFKAAVERANEFENQQLVEISLEDFLSRPGAPKVNFN